MLCDIYRGSQSQGNLLVDSWAETGIDSWMLQCCLCPSEVNPVQTIHTPITEDRALVPWWQVALLSCGDKMLHSRWEGKNLLQKQCGNPGGCFSEEAPALMPFGVVLWGEWKHERDGVVLSCWAGLNAYSNLLYREINLEFVEGIFFLAKICYNLVIF